MELKLLDVIDYNQCIALIPARGGSKSVPKKNIRLINNHPMIAYSIVAANLSEKIQRVIVSTDSEEIAEIAVKYGAEVPFMRPSEYAQDDSPDIDVVRHLIQWLYDKEGKIPEYIVHLRPTTPFRNPFEIDKAVVQIMEEMESTSLRSGSICTHPPFKWFKKQSKYLSPLMPGMTCDEANLPRQDFPEVYIPNGYVDVVKADFIIRNDLMHGDKMIGYKTVDIPDIDTESDLKKLVFYDNLKETFEILISHMDSQIRSVHE